MTWLGRGCCSAPSFWIFSSLLTGWVLVDRVRQPRGKEVPRWRGPAVLEGSKTEKRAASVSLWLYAAILTWYIRAVGRAVSWTARPWYPTKANPIFLDALASLRRVLWAERIAPVSSHESPSPEILAGLLAALATVGWSWETTDATDQPNQLRTARLHVYCLM